MALKKQIAFFLANLISDKPCHSTPLDRAPFREVRCFCEMEPSQHVFLGVEEVLTFRTPSPSPPHTNQKQRQTGQINKSQACGF